MISEPPGLNVYANLFEKLSSQRIDEILALLQSTPEKAQMIGKQDIWNVVPPLHKVCTVFELDNRSRSVLRDKLPVLMRSYEGGGGQSRQTKSPKSGPLEKYFRIASFFTWAMQWCHVHQCLRTTSDFQPNGRNTNSCSYSVY